MNSLRNMDFAVQRETKRSMSRNILKRNTPVLSFKSTGVLNVEVNAIILLNTYCVRTQRILLACG